MRAGAAFALLAAAVAVQAQPVAVVWDADGSYRTVAPIRAGKVVEACASLGAGESVEWSFESPVALDFNIHFHEGSRVEYPVAPHAAARASGTLVPMARHDYCWMWTHRGRAASELVLTLRRAAR